MAKRRINKQKSIYDTTTRKSMEDIFDSMQGQIDRQKDAITRLVASVFGTRASLEAIADEEGGLDLAQCREAARTALAVMDAATAAAQAPDTGN